MRGTMTSLGTDKTVFIECFAQLPDGYPCLETLGISDDRSISDRDAATFAHKKGWKVSGYYGAKITRCPSHKNVRKSADVGPLILTTGRARQ